MAKTDTTEPGNLITDDPVNPNPAGNPPKDDSKDKSEPFKVDGKVVTEEEIKQLRQDAKDKTAMKTNMDKAIEVANSYKDNAEKFQKLSQIHGENVVGTLLQAQDAQKNVDEPLLPQINDERWDKDVVDFENARNLKISDHAKSIDDKISRLTNVVQQVVSVVGRNDIDTAQRNFAEDHGIDLKTQEGRKFMNDLIVYGKENKCFPLHGSEGAQYHYIDKNGLETAQTLYSIRQGQKGLADNNLAETETAIRNLLAGNNDLPFKIELTPSRQAEVTSIDVSPILAKFKNNQPLSQIEADALRATNEVYVPSDYPISG